MIGHRKVALACRPTAKHEAENAIRRHLPEENATSDFQFHEPSVSFLLSAYVQMCKIIEEVR